MGASTRRVDLAEVTSFIAQNIERFHARRLDSLQSLHLVRVLKRKNPYLFKAKNQITSHDLVKSILDAHLSSQEEGSFGHFLEDLAIFISEKAFGGRKSSAEGIDLEFTRDGVMYLVAIKSGPNWGNSSQIGKMRDHFRKARRILGTNPRVRNITTVNGCCYGKDRRPNKGDYLKLCGQAFWELVSGQRNFYTAIIEPLGHRAKQRNERFLSEYAKVVNRFTLEFTKSYCDRSGAILWKKLVQFNSGIV